MSWQPTPWADPLLLSAVVSASLAVFSLLYVAVVRRDRRVIAFSILMVGAAVWTVGYSFQFASAGLTGKLRWMTASTIGAAIVPAAWFTFSAAYARRDRWLAPRLLALIWLVPVLTIALTVTNASHGLLWSDPTLVDAQDGSYLVANVSRGGWYFVHGGYSYLAAFGGAFFVIGLIERSHGLYRGQAALLLFGILVPAAAHLVSLADIGPGAVVDLTSPSMAVLGVAFAVGIFGYRMFDLVPVARASVVETMGVGYVLLGEADEVLDLNDAARSFLDAPDGRLLGREVRSAFGVDLGDLPHPPPGEWATETIDISEDESEYVDVVVWTIETDGVTGRLLVVRDVTERVERQEELRRTNERLDQFASLLSHDLRNPLNIAMGRLEMAIETGENSHLETVEKQHDRMETMIDDMLTMARAGMEIDATEPIDLEAIARESWESVDTYGGTLSIEGSRSIRGERSRLRNLFENLFRNAVEHGTAEAEGDDGSNGADLVVTVEPTEDGFAVSDNGPGIDPDVRDRLFESGVTTESGNTGLGLAIVRDVVDAHGWTIEACESKTGGARFEIGELEGEANGRDRRFGRSPDGTDGSDDAGDERNDPDETEKSSGKEQSTGCHMA